MKSLEEKLKSINKPGIKYLRYGKAITLAELWDNLIEQYLPSEKTVADWNKLLFKYIASDKAVFAIRGYNTFPREKYGDLRRGFLTNTDKGFSFFYTDNFFAAYFCKMAIDNYVPNFDEFYDIIKNRKFPARFGIDTAEERELMAIHKGKDPGINSAGFKIAHIIPVGQKYYFNGKTIGIKEILEKYFPKGERADWNQKIDNMGAYFVRKLKTGEAAKEILTAHFLRFIHPLNYFLAPKKNLETNCRCKEIAENEDLLKYAQYRFLKKYGQLYTDYLKLIMYNEPININDNGSYVVNITYGGNQGLYKETSISLTPRLTTNNGGTIDKSIEWLMVIEYLMDPSTSFRKLEQKILHIESKVRGGGFIAKKIINDYGITVEKKGILSIYSLEEEIKNSTGQYHDFLTKILLPLCKK